MDKDQTFPQQEAPLKNTDDAFVKVASDGSPIFEEDGQAKQKKEEEKKEDPS